MNKILKFNILLAALLLTVICIASCSFGGPPYDDLDKDGYVYSVKFDVGNGLFADTVGVTMVDVFTLDEVKAGASLLTPDSTDRGNNAFKVSYTGHYLAGWYTSCEPRVNDKGEALDEYGNLCSESGLPQGKSYSGRWDFKEDTLPYDESKEYTSNEPAVTLYAAWIPYPKFEFYIQNGNEWELIKGVDTEKIDGEEVAIDYLQELEIQIPAWDVATGKLKSTSFISLEGKTLDKVYTDATMTQEYAPGQIVSGQPNYENGTGATDTVKLYTTWRDGEWFRIYTAKQFYDNRSLNGCYELCADIDFANTSYWPTNITKGVFNGKIIGNGYKMMNINVTQTDTKAVYGGIFAQLGDSAVITDVVFENITFTLNRGSMSTSPSFGLLAGAVSDNTTLTNVSVSGKFCINPEIYKNSDYSLNLLFGYGNAGEIDLSGITCELTDKESTAINVDVDETTGEITLTYN